MQDTELIQENNTESVSCDIILEDGKQTGQLSTDNKPHTQPTSPFLPTKDAFGIGIEQKNAIIKAFIQNRNNFDSSWTEAAEAVFSDSHPFNVNKRQRIPQQPTTNDKKVEPVSDSCSTISSPPKPNQIQKTVNLASRKKNTKNSSASKKKRVIENHVNQENITEIAANPMSSENEKDRKEQQQGPQTSATAEEGQKNSDARPQSPKSGDEKRTIKKKKSSHYMSRRNSSFINSERLIHIKSKVEAAVREHKVYSMTGHYGSVRKALKERGWVEKIDSDLKGRRRSFKIDDADGTPFYVLNKQEGFSSTKDSSGHCEAEIINRMLRNITEDLCWLSKPYPYCWKDVNKCDMINRLPKAYFSNKVGLANCLANMQWYYEVGVCSTQYPRTYNISVRDEYDAFQDDFRLTACVSTLKWITNSYRQAGEMAVWSPEGRVDTNIVDFSIKRCTEYVRFREHEDIDLMEMTKTWDHQWDHFLTQYYKLVNEGFILREIKEDAPITVIVSNAQAALNMLRPYWPQMDMEGINDWWIVKPGGRCCGNGIVIRNNLDQIMAIVNPSITRETRYVVQKYIEKPLLIYNTKFDIRQWFLVTNVYPLTIWMYKESYLRFCSTIFSLKTMHESVHLCNNAVQRRYKNGKRDSNLPDENMWDCYTFQTHLKAIGYPDAWEELIYPGMRQSFVGALLASQDNLERRRNCFELYGADFMISDQITDGPWLIEINSNPAMDASTSVTARMCPQVLEDIIKVVIDRRNDRNASTGAFELAYRQNCPPIPPYLGMSLCIKGKKVYKSCSESKYLRRPNFHQESSDSDDSSSSEEVNIVQKRCCTDFMQPIKTLRDEIQKLGRHREDYLAVKSDNNMSDSWANDSDTSRGSTDRRMALEGKEIELKKKKIRKKRQKHPQHLIASKARDYLDKAINKRSRSQMTKESNAKANVKMSNIKRESVGSVFEKSNVVEVRRSGVKEDVSETDALRLSENQATEVFEASPDALHPLIITGLWEPEHSDFSRYDEVCDSGRKRSSQRTSPAVLNRKVFLHVNGASHSSRDNSNSSRASASSVPESDRNSSDAADSMASYSRHFKRNYFLNKSTDLSTALSITAPDLMVKGRSKSSKWNYTKSSIDYFREWKYKIDETRKNCEDVLNKLRCFKEDNSKKKFQDLIRQKTEEENRILAQIKKSKTNNGDEKTNATKGRRTLDAVESEWCHDGREKKAGNGLSAQEAHTQQLPGGTFNGKSLAKDKINVGMAEAIRSVHSLPKIKPRTKSLSNNGNKKEIMR